jgi:hypothetical protein
MKEILLTTTKAFLIKLVQTMGESKAAQKTLAQARVRSLRKEKRLENRVSVRTTIEGCCDIAEASKDSWAVL